jgi:hypothetical protein
MIEVTALTERAERLTLLRTNRSVVITPMWSFERIHPAEPEAIGI